MGTLRPLLPWLACVALSGCVGQSRMAAVPDAVALRAGLPLLSPASLGQERRISQLLRGEYGGTAFNLRCVVTVDAQELAVIGLTGLGMRAFTLKYDGQQLQEQRAPQVPEGLQAQSLLNDLQLVLWPLRALQEAWQGSGVELNEPYPGTRRLTRAGVLVAEVHYDADGWQGRVWLRHFDYPYTLYIESNPLGRDGS